MKPPSSVQLPSGRVVELVVSGEPAPRVRAPSDPLFADAVALFASGGVALRERGKDVDVRSLELRDFHALRAIGTRLGWLHEETLEVACRNCDEPIRHAPCAALALGPFVDRELSDPDLDRTLDLSAPHEIPPVTLEGGATARTVTLSPVTVAQAEPLHRALRRRTLSVSARLIRAMGVAALGEERDPDRIADALARCPDEAWDTITDLFLAAHYPPRLFSALLCPSCGARNDVDAPYDREFEPAESHHARAHDESAIHRESNEQTFPTFDEFDACARAVADGILGARFGDVTLVVEGGVAACDDGGEPLLGSYVPPHPGDATSPTRAAEITLYYRTFRAMWTEDGPYDWDAELAETIEHELDHHVSFLAGDDPVDDEERAVIAREAAAIVGRKELVRGSLRAFGGDFAGFLRRTWPVWLILLVATIVVTLSSR